MNNTQVLLIILLVVGFLFVFGSCGIVCSGGEGEAYRPQDPDKEWTCDECLKFCDAGDPAMCTVLCQDVCQDQGCRPDLPCRWRNTATVQP